MNNLHLHDSQLRQPQLKRILAGKYEPLNSEMRKREFQANKMDLDDYEVRHLQGNCHMDMTNLLLRRSSRRKTKNKLFFCDHCFYLG